MSRRSAFSVGLALALVCAPGANRLLAQDDDAERSALKQSHEYKEFRWIDETAGDCRMSGILTIFDNGYAIWTASTKTDSTVSGDIWHESLEVVDDQGRRLFGFGVWDSPRMFEGSQYNWRNTGRFSPGFFEDASRARSVGEC